MGTNRSNDGSTVPPFGLIPCPECRKFVSAKAQVCPHCGRPIRESLASILLKVVLACLIVAAVVAVALLIKH
jgi:hypothetical protein